MNRWNRIALSVGALLVMSAPILAQTPQTPATPAAPKAGRGGQARRASMTGVPVGVIDALVMLTAEQKTKITTIDDKLKVDVAAAAGDRAKTRELTTAATEEIKVVLTSDQQKVLTEKLPVVMLLNQSKAVPYSVYAEVKLTSDQFDKIKTLAVATQDKQKAVARADRKTQNPIILADFKTQVETVLTDAQKATISKAPKAKKKVAV